MIYAMNPVWGADPEFFFEKDGQVIGSEKVIPEKGLMKDYSFSSGSFGQGKIVRDGVQAEFNPDASGNAGCRANFGNEMQGCFHFLARHIQKTDPKLKMNILPLVEVDPKEMDSLSDRSKILGCMPSLNLYDHEANIGVDGAIYKKRSAGGHIHFGLGANYKCIPNWAERSVAMLDAMVGNTCVLLDQNPLNAERRQVYGRAGEYRLPAHGLEYRTLSNFWLRAYPLLSMILGLSRYALGTVYSGSANNTFYDPAKQAYVARDNSNLEQELFSQLDQKQVVKAINENDYKLAFQNWEVVRSFILKHITNGASGGIGANYMPWFDHFLSRTREKGLDFWFPDEPLTYWTEKMIEGHQSGMETFLNGAVKLDMTVGQVVPKEA